MAMDNTKSPSRDLLALTVLALLSERPLHPYAIQRTIRDRRKAFALGSGRALYRAVERLVAAGWIEPAETTREGRRPERTAYRITDAGREELQSWLSELVQTILPEAPVFESVTSFLGYLDPADAARALRHRTVALRSRIASLEVARSELQQGLRLPRLVLLELEAERARLRAELSWAAEVATDFESGALAVDWSTWWAEGGQGTARWPGTDDLEQVPNPPGPAGLHHPDDPGPVPAIHPDRGGRPA